MSWNIWPTEGSAGLGVGTFNEYPNNMPSEETMRQAMWARSRCPFFESFLIEGFDCYAAQWGGKITAGKCWINGFYVESDAELDPPSFTASNLNYIYVQLTKTASLVTGASLVANITGTLPTDACCIGIYNDDSTIYPWPYGSHTSMRMIGAGTIPSAPYYYLYPGVYGIYYSTNYTLDNYFHLGFRPRYINIDTTGGGGIDAWITADGAHLGSGLKIFTVGTHTDAVDITDWGFTLKANSNYLPSGYYQFHYFRALP